MRFLAVDLPDGGRRSKNGPAERVFGWYRFVECADVDDSGEPRGEIAPYQDIVFPFEASLRDVGLKCLKLWKSIILNVLRKWFTNADQTALIL